MASITLTFTKPINVSCQVGDIAYYVTSVSNGGFDTGFNNQGVSNGVVKIGDIREIESSGEFAGKRIYVNTSLGYAGSHNVSTLSYIMFTKDTKVNLSSPLGYYASVKFINDSKTEAEMFSVGMDVFDSSSETRG